MSRGDYRTFTLDLSDTTCIDEVVEAMIQKKVDEYDEKIQSMQEIIDDWKNDYDELDARNTELENKLVEYEN